MDLQAIRQDIDRVDQELVTLLEERMKLVVQVTAYKKETGMAVLDSGREDEVLKKVAESVENKEFEESLVETFRDVLKRSREFQSSKLH